MARVKIELDETINKLKSEYLSDVLNSFIEHERYDLVLGFAKSKKGAVIKGDGKIYFVKTEENLAGKQTHVNYRDKQTDKITQVYNAKIKNKGIEPNAEWGIEAKNYVSNLYKGLVKKYEKLILEHCKDWECIAFASRVPLITIELFEDKIIDSNSSLKILAFAQEVKGANIQKLGSALKKIGNTHYENVEYTLKGKSYFEKVKIDHIKIFEEKFGKIAEESEK